MKAQYYEIEYHNLPRTVLWSLYLYIHRMNFDIHYETEHCNLQGHGSLTPIYLYIHTIDSDMLSATSSSPQCNTKCSIKQRLLNAVLRYGAHIEHLVCNIMLVKSIEAQPRLTSYCNIGFTPSQRCVSVFSSFLCSHKEQEALVIRVAGESYYSIQCHDSPTLSMLWLSETWQDKQTIMQKNQFALW